MNFSEFVGNKRIIQYFRAALERGHLGHAYLFSGPEGVGKSTLARLICGRLHCRNSQPEGACGTCSACAKLESGNHPDFHFYAAEGLYFKIDQVRQIIHEASLKPVESSWKTFLLEDLDYMREEASNAFLKVLEEPPGQTIFFLICRRAESLLPTVRSRCQRFDFQPLLPSEIMTWLMQMKGLSEKEASDLSRYTHGSIGRALSVNPEQYKEMRDKVLIALEGALAPKAYVTLIDSIRAITVERTDMEDRLVILEELARDLLLLKASDQARLIHEDSRARLVTLAESTSRYLLQKFYENLLETREVILKVNANISLSLQALLLPLRVGVEEDRRKSA